MRSKVLYWLLSANIALFPSLADGSPPSVAAPQQRVRPASGFQYPTGQHGAGSLRYVNGVPVLQVAGTPDQIGEQIGVLALRPARRLMQFPDDLLRQRGLTDRRPLIVQVGNLLLASALEAHRAELQAVAEHGQADIGTLILINTVDDLERIGGCSSIVVLGKRSATGHPIMARNLDYAVPAYVPEYTLVTVYRPDGKLPFAAVGFPGLVGIMSGINQAGLTVATHDVSASADGSSSFAVTGAPMTLSFRRILEECRTVQEATALMKSVRRTTYLSISVCDPQTAAVLELTPSNVVVRRPEEQLLVCTNHFRSEPLRVSLQCGRYNVLSAIDIQQAYDVPALWKQLHKGSVSATLQAMVFEPAQLRLHLAYGVPRATSRAPRLIELAELLAPSGRREE